jgi:subtilisin-like proprotein convertase family protein
VSGLGNSTEKISVTLRNITHSYPSDIDVLLVSPTGKKFIVLSDVIGGENFTGRTYTFDDAATSLIAATGIPPASGTFRPTNYGVTEAFTAPAPAAPYLSPASGGSDTFASAFGGDNPNGTWSLYALDDSEGDSGQFAGGWSITVTPASYQCAAIPTAADVSASGRVRDRQGRAITGAFVTITDDAGLSRSARTNTFGYFTITGLPAGRSYIVTTAARRYSFEPQLLTIDDNVSSFEIVSRD